jgi:multicomponent Na+:H+ antiporter subunit D
MGAFVSLAVVVPFLAAAALATLSPLGLPRLAHVLAATTGATVTVLCAVVLVHAEREPIVHWFGAWRPRDGHAIGIAFAVDAFGGALALLAAVLVTATLVFSWHYFEGAGVLFPVLVLVFLGAMTGFAFTGDLFNLFVFFELMSVSAFALTAYRVEHTSPLHGALNVAVTNSVGGILIL